MGDRRGPRGGIADALAAALRPELGWYADFAVGDERIVVFAGRVFRIGRGEGAGLGRPRRARPRRARPGQAGPGRAEAGRGGPGLAKAGRGGPGRAEALAYGRSVGTPEHQLDRGG
ncbi:hypothetical protein [Streptomyces canus]|uniref:hypothetical protein n=1 Tax=Streptomyces canus TaxID=58343 RepID=UPI003CEA288B